MTADHVNTVLLDRALPPLWALGRTAFPLFALLAAWNLTFRSRAPGRYLARMAIWAAVATPIYQATFGPSSLRLNPLFTLALGVAVGWACVARPAVRVWLLSALALSAALEHWMGTWVLVFGTTGALLVVALALWLRERSIVGASLAVLSAAALNLERSVPLSLASGAICLLTLGAAQWAAQRRRSTKQTMPPGWLRRHGFYFYYPAHLLALLLLWNWLNVW